MTAMLRAVSWAFRGLRNCSKPLSARMSSNSADRSCALAEKVAVITGSTKGIGFAIARRLAQDGAHVVISSRKQQNVDQAVATLQGEGLSVTGTVCHVGKAEDRERLVATALEHCGGVDFLVCVAGVNPLVGSTLGASEQVWDKILDVNVKSPALLLSQLLPHMENRGTGSVVLVSSMVAYVPIPEKSLPYLLPDLNDIYGLQRFGEPEECAGIVAFLCSPDASYITGENIVVAGYSPKL
ncbi:dehydrogenase/reductase SDR family member 2, mitochondrial-like isoform X2 [Mustela erminea]|uniref:dehydrogenase/reductase SDR family member 2, mitochondrial-like isoform X2 n=1 Tax=Mustela erminea TaxID=36723 RepID=UPI00138682DA|nr:dehydrogenase/reductase SDR family member 2, mitochondrial-like isoform X2 [Mustela erminea]